MSTAPDAIAGQISRAAELLQSGRTDQALAEYHRVLEADPGNADAHNGRGVALRAMRRFEPALESFSAALRLHPAHRAAAGNYGLTLHDLGRSTEAAAQLRRVIGAHPAHRPSLHNLGMILHSIDRHEEAADCYARLVELAPDFEYAAGNLARARMACCDWSSFESDRQRIMTRLAAGIPAADPLTALMAVDSAGVQLECARRFAARHYPATAPPLWRGERHRHDRIRVAYLSADFHDHPVAHLLAGVLEGHDRRQFEIMGLSLRREPSPGAMHARLRRACEHFDDVEGMDDRSVAERLRHFETDIAVDLGGFTRGGRLGILAHRPAPIQVNFLGFAGTYGAAYVDYVIADAVVIPGGREQQFSEQVVRLPHSFLPNDDRQPVADGGTGRRDMGLPEDGFVFCAFSNAYKITPPLFDIWMNLLREMPGSVLWLRQATAATTANLRKEAAARGVPPERLVFAPRMADMGRHLARHRLADLFLDTAPYGAHATSRDALWAGLPVLTCAGESFASRVAASLLTALAIPELICSDLPTYHRTARHLANTPEVLAGLRRRLAQRRLTGPPFATDPFRRHLEAAFRGMWERGQRGEPPASFDVVPDATVTPRSSKSQPPHFSR